MKKDGLTLTSKTEYDEESDCNYISFNISDDSKNTYYKCSNGWRLFDIKYLGFEKGSDNILVISADTGV